MQKGRECSIEDIAKKLEITYNHTNYHIIFTGGEPLLKREDIEAVIEACGSLVYPPSQFEIETNGTIAPPNTLMENKNIIWNISVKLPNSGIASNIRIHPKVLQTFIDMQQNGSIINWKFVVNRNQDVYDALNIFHQFDYEVPRNTVYFMPGAYSMRQASRNSQKVIEYCKLMGVNYSPRLQIFVYGKTVGV
jgi:6-pyruvoyltetrahydropterin 2'-reductase